MDCFHAEVYFCPKAQVGKTKQGCGCLESAIGFARDIRVRDNEPRALTGSICRGWRFQRRLGEVHVDATKRRLPHLGGISVPRKSTLYSPNFIAWTDNAGVTWRRTRWSCRSGQDHFFGLRSILLATTQARCQQICIEVPCMPNREGKLVKYRTLHPAARAWEHLGRSKHGFCARTSEDPTRYGFYFCSCWSVLQNGTLHSLQENIGRHPRRPSFLPGSGSIAWSTKIHHFRPRCQIPQPLLENSVVTIRNLSQLHQHMSSADWWTNRGDQPYSRKYA